VPGWTTEFAKNNENVDTDDETYEKGFIGENGRMNGTSKLEGDSDSEEVPENKFDEYFHKVNSDEGSVGQKDLRSEDPFNIYSFLNKKQGENNKESNLDDSLKYPL
nr:nucleotide-binding alpha-beta plait domain-containing protein [Tanacetum cinerariifolium]